MGKQSIPTLYGSLLGGFDSVISAEEDVLAVMMRLCHPLLPGLIPSDTPQSGRSVVYLRAAPVFKILLSSCGPEMVGSNAILWACSAVVHFDRVAQHPIRQLIRIAMRANKALTIPKAAIAPRISSAGPQPARISLRHLCPKVALRIVGEIRSHAKPPVSLDAEGSPSRRSIARASSGVITPVSIRIL